MVRFWVALIAFWTVLGLGGACWAEDASLGLYAHDIPLMGKRVHERGEELIAAVGTDPIKNLKLIGSPSAYVTGGLNMQNKTDFAAAGLRWKVDLTKAVYVQAGAGLSMNDAPTHPVPGRVYSGSHLTFEPEVSVGHRLTRNVSVELSFIHLSHAYLFSNRNPGINELGMRLVVKFDRHDLLRHLHASG